MLRYVSKFLLDIMPPVAATVIGAWIVTHYINPRTDAVHPQTEASATKESAPKQLLSGASGMSPRNVEEVAVKPVADEAAEAKKAVREKPVVAARPAAPRTEARVEEKRDTREATDLARAALDRLKSQPAETSHAVQASGQPVSAPIAAPVLASTPMGVTSPAPAAAAPIPVAAPALPPPVVIVPSREVAIQPLFNDPARPTPPADIPVRSADASFQAPAAEGRSLIGGIASAAKSLVDVVIPR